MSEAGEQAFGDTDLRALQKKVKQHLRKLKDD